MYSKKAPGLAFLLHFFSHPILLSFHLFRCPSFACFVIPTILLFLLFFFTSLIPFLGTGVGLVQSRLPHGANLFGDPKKSFAAFFFLFFFSPLAWDASSPVSWKRFSIVAWIHKRLPCLTASAGKEIEYHDGKRGVFVPSSEWGNRVHELTVSPPPEDLLICFAKFAREQLVYPWLGWFDRGTRFHLIDGWNCERERASNEMRFKWHRRGMTSILLGKENKIAKLSAGLRI